MALTTRTVVTQEYGSVQLDQEGFRPTLDTIAARVENAISLLPMRDQANLIAIAREVGVELRERVTFLTRQFPVECIVRVQLGKTHNSSYATPVLVVMGHSSEEEGLPIYEMMAAIKDQHESLRRHLSDYVPRGSFHYCPGCDEDSPNMPGTVEWNLMVIIGRKALMLQLTLEIDRVPNIDSREFKVSRGACEPSMKTLTTNSNVTRMLPDSALFDPNIYKEWQHRGKRTDVTPDVVRQKIVENAVRRRPPQPVAVASAAPSSAASAPPRISHQQAVQIAAQGGGLAALMPRMSGGVRPPLTQHGELLQLTAGPSSAVALPWEQGSTLALAWQGNDSNINGLD